MLDIQSEVAEEESKIISDERLSDMAQPAAAEGAEDEASKAEKPASKPLATTVTLTQTKANVLGKRARTKKWERRWVLVPNVLDLNQGEIWVQKWVTVDSAQ